MAQYSKKRQKELQHDAFRDNTLHFLDRLGDRLEGKGLYIIYGLAGLLTLAILMGIFSWRNNRKEQEARQALGRAIQISEATIGTTPSTDGSASEFNFPTEQDRARKSVEEFQKVADKYGEPFHSKALYLAAINQLALDRMQGINQLEKLKNDGSTDVSTWAKFALAQGYEANGENDKAATLYQDLMQRSDAAIPADVSKERLASVYEKMGKKKEAVDLLYGIVESSRNAKDKDGKPVTQSGTAREAERRLQILDPARYQQLPALPAVSPFSNLNLG